MGAASFVQYAERNRFPTGMTERVERQYGRMVRVMEQAYGPWPDAKTAMEYLADDDRIENGHHPEGVGGKYDMVHIATVVDQAAAEDLADELITKGDRRILDKRGPAGCITIETGEKQFLFFGFVAT